MSNLIHINSLDDDRLLPYRAMKDRDLAVMPGGLFIAEGELPVKRLLANTFAVHSVLLSQKREAEIAPLVPGHVPVYVAPAEIINGTMGFKFHAGIIAAGKRPAPVSLSNLISPSEKPLTLMVCPELANTENLGGMIRIAAAFGCAALVLGERSCDPFFRQSVRVSMGTVFTLPIVRSANILDALRELRAGEVELIAAVLDESAEPLSNTTRSPRAAILFGSEAHGLTSEQIGLCDRRVTIPMKLGTDSLNVAVAAGIFLHHFTTGEAFSPSPSGRGPG